MKSGEPFRVERCPLCGCPNGCVPARCGSFAEPCWCERESFGAALLDRLPAGDRGRACICAACVRAGEVATVARLGNDACP